MDPLYELVHGLSPKELGVVKSYLGFFSGTQRAEDTLPVKLFNYLLSRKLAPSENDICIFIYGTDKNKQDQFKKLKYRLKTKILDALCTDLNDEKKEMLDEVDYASFRVRKKAIQSRLLFFSNPKLEIARELLEEIISECKKYELYGVLTEHLDIKRFRYTFKSGEKEFDKVIKEAQYYKECSDAVTKANDYYYKLIFISEKNVKNDKKVAEFLKNSIAELKELVQKTKSNAIRYYLKFFELYQFMRKKDYEGARNICSELTELILNNPAVKRKQRLGIAYDHFALCELLLGDFEKALEHAKAAQENFITSSLNHSLSKEQEFYALFYGKKYQEAETVSVMMLASASRKELGEARYAKYNFLHANILFQLGKFKESLNILNEKWELSDEKGSKEAELRVLRIMTLVELNDYNQAQLQIESLKKFVQRNEEKTHFRHKTIVKALLQAERKDFCFDKNSEHLKLLSSSDEKCKWELLSSELIPFHEWAKTKTGR